MKINIYLVLVVLTLLYFVGTFVFGMFISDPVSTTAIFILLALAGWSLKKLL